LTVAILAPAVGEQIVTKGHFAELIGVSPGRVSQMISEGKIGPEALDGEGRSARIRVEQARAHLRERTDLGQRLGNGMATRLDGQLPLMPPPRLAVGARESAPQQAGAEGVNPSLSPTQPKDPGPVDPYADRLKQLKLADAERRERQALEEELAARGTYVRADRSRAALNGVAATILNVFEGSIADLAQALATQFEIPQRDLMHVLRKEFLTIRVKAAAAARQRAEGLPALIMDDADAAQGEVDTGEG